MNETHLPSEEDRNWQDQEQARDEAWRQHEVEEAFKLVLVDWRFSLPTLRDAEEKEWVILAQALEDRFPGFLKFYRAL